MRHTEALALDLTPRERQVMQHTALGRTNSEVAAELEVTIHAVKFHLASIFRKLGVTNRTEAAAVYLRRDGG
jgi:DNA-binding CsgD family transcriptional regulator